MKWTKKNYPAAMKKLPAAIRNKAIEIANALSKANAKMHEGILIATAVMHALKNTVMKTTKADLKKAAQMEKKVAKTLSSKKKTAVKTKPASKKKAVKKAATAKKKMATTKAAPKKKVAASKKKIKNKVATKKVIAKKKPSVKKSAPKKIEKGVVRKTAKPATSKKETEQEALIPEIILPGKDMHFIPEHNGQHPISSFEAHKVEKVFHNHEEVALHQENQKVKQSMTARKNAKNIYRSKGRR